MKILGTLSETPLNGLAALKSMSQTGLVFCFPGVGSAFSKTNNHTSLIIAKNGTTILVDIGTNIPRALSTRNISPMDFDYYHITHSHSDHMGGLEEILLRGRYITRKKARLIITERYQYDLWEKSLKGGCEHNESQTLTFTDLVHPIHPTPIVAPGREIFEIWIDDIHLLIFRTFHSPGGMNPLEQSFWSTGLLVDGKALYTADTRFDPSLFSDLPLDRLETIYHDCQLSEPGIVHASYSELKTLPEEIRKKMYLVHYGDEFEKFNPTQDGFAGFTQPWQIYFWKSSHLPNPNSSQTSEDQQAGEWDPAGRARRTKDNPPPPRPRRRIRHSFSRN